MLGLGLLKSLFGWVGHHEDAKLKVSAEQYETRAKLIINAWATRFVVVVVFIPWIISFFAILFGWNETADKVDEALGRVNDWPSVYLTWLNSTVHACLGIVGVSHVAGHIQSGIRTWRNSRRDKENG